MDEINWYRHDIIYRLCMMSLKLRNISAIRIGASKEDVLFSPVNLPIIRIMLGDNITPYIPGSSIKGVFRNVIENILVDSGHRDGKLESEDHVMKISQMISSLYKENRSYSTEEVLKLVSRFGLVSKVFGAPSYSSLIEFSDFYPANNVKIKTGVRDGVAIERRYGSVKHFYKVEYIEPGSVFEGTILIKNPPNYVIGMVFDVIHNYINTGLVRLGGFKSKGFGKVEMEVYSVDIRLLKNAVLSQVDKETLNPLDKFDKEIFFDREDLESFIDSSIEVWRSYVEENRD